MNNAFDPSSSRSIESQRTMRGDAPAPVRRLRAGDMLLARYTVLSELGEGGMGVVYKCLDKVGGIEVAVKCLPPELSRNEGEMEGIRENYGIVAKLHHSAISGLRQLERDPVSGEYYLVMDLAEGEDLSAILRRRRGRPMPLAEALAILRPLASALDYAHGERVLHRDVKPANVKVRPAAEPGGAPCVQLLDFGLAAEVRSSMSRVSMRGHGGTSGTPAYMAPEQWEARRPDFRTDQYALAVVAYQMLAGFLPFDSEDTDVLRRAVLSRAPDPIPGLPRAANAALLRALAKDPKERFPTCAAFVEALEGRDGSTSRPPDGRAVGASLPETARGEGREEARAEIAESVESGSPSDPPRSGARASRPRIDDSLRSLSAPQDSSRLEVHGGFRHLFVAALLGVTVVGSIVAVQSGGTVREKSSGMVQDIRGGDELPPVEPRAHLDAVTMDSEGRLFLREGDAPVSLEEFETELMARGTPGMNLVFHCASDVPFNRIKEVTGIATRLGFTVSVHMFHSAASTTLPVPTTTTTTRHVVPSPLPTTTTVTHPLRSSPSPGPRLSAEEVSRLLSAGAEVSDHTSIPSSEMSRCFAIINRAIRNAWIQPDAASITGINPQISISVGAGGVVQSVSLSKSSGNAVFDQSVLSAARAVRKFEGLSEEFVRAKPTFTVEFNLREAD